MRKYHVTYKTWLGRWTCEHFVATCDTDARFIARMIYRDKVLENLCCGFSLIDFFGNHIEL